jgi:hypothetical protein
MLGLKAHTKIAAPMGLLTMMFTLTVNPGAAEQESWIPLGFFPNVIMFVLVVPVVMLAVYGIRRLSSRSSGA